jgi:hypothetical protein
MQPKKKNPIESLQKDEEGILQQTKRTKNDWHQKNADR